MPRPSYFHLAVACAALALFAAGTAGGILLRDPPEAKSAEQAEDSTSAPGEQTAQMLEDGDLELAVASVTRAATVPVPVEGSARLRASKGQQLAKADFQLTVTSSAPRPSLCAPPKKGKAARIAGAILVDTAGEKYAPRQDSVEVGLSNPCDRQAPFLAAPVTLVFEIPEIATPATLLLFDPREPGDEKGLTRLRFPVNPERA